MVFRVLAASALTIFLAIPAAASAVDVSLRPVSRAAAEAPQPERVTLASASLAAPRGSLRPTLRPRQPARPEIVVPASTQAGFTRWINGFRARALRQGIRASVFDAAFRNVRYDPEVIAKDRNQSEFTKTIGDYLASAASQKRVRNGKAALRKHRRLLDGIEARYGVDRDIVVAVWGLESAYGEFRGDKPLIGSLATLAYDGRRGRFFEKQLIAALKILQNGDVRPSDMTGSWAGAMGHTQFIPTSYQALAVDFSGDGKRDIWSDNPADALASTANYLARSGWRSGQPWGVEVLLPRGFDYARVGGKMMPSDWARLGVRDVQGRPVRDYGTARLFLPAGARGAAFLVFRNFDVIKRYNNADAYALGVGHLSDRISGAGPLRASWPKDTRALTFAERRELQARLTRRGFDTQGVDGKIGPRSIAAIRAFQRSIGEPADGVASLHILKKLR